MTRRRVTCYATRNTKDGLQLLVFRHPHREAMTYGVQTPGGTVEQGERPVAAARRELFEEAGLTDTHIVRVHDLRRDTCLDDLVTPPQTLERHFVWLELARGLPDNWTHVVSAGELDKGLVFAYFWLSVPEAKKGLGPMGDYLELLASSLAAERV